MLVSYTTKELDQLARLMRAEAVGEGDYGMLMVGNVAVNRVIADCLDFLNIRTVTDMLQQSPGGFSGYNSPLYLTGAATTRERDLAERVLRGEYYFPATNALWFYAPKTGVACVAYWYNQKNSGRYKSHCFYEPALSVCQKLH